MVPDPGQPLEHRGNPRERPEIGRKPMGQRAMAQGRIELGQLSHVERRLASQPTGRLEPGLAAGLPRLEPPMGRDRGYAECPRDRRLGLAPRKPPRRPEAARFQRCHLASSGHASTWHRTRRIH